MLHGEYDGTSDTMQPNMFLTTEERNEQWRKQKWKKCECESEKLPCVVESHYGGGFSWDGSACKECMVFLGPYTPYDEPDVEIRYGRTT